MKKKNTFEICEPFKIEQQIIFLLIEVIILQKIKFSHHYIFRDNIFTSTVNKIKPCQRVNYFCLTIFHVYHGENKFHLDYVSFVHYQHIQLHFYNAISRKQHANPIGHSILIPSQTFLFYLMYRFYQGNNEFQFYHLWFDFTTHDLQHSGQVRSPLYNRYRTQLTFNS